MAPLPRRGATRVRVDAPRVHKTVGEAQWKEARKAVHALALVAPAT